MSITSPPSGPTPTTGRPAQHSATSIELLRRLVSTEARLFVREPVGLIFVFAFPVLTVLIIGSSFEADDPAFGGAEPSAYYIAAYIGVVLAAVGLVMLPVHLASYRERGVLRRFDASPFPSWSLPTAWIVVAVGLTTTAIITLLATTQLVFGVPPVDDLVGTLVAIALAVWTTIGIGLALGLALPTARAAQGVGLALFFPSFLLGGAGPPPDVMPDVMRSVANLVPTTHVVEAIQRQWLGIGGSATVHLVVLAVLGTVATATWMRETTVITHD